MTRFAVVGALVALTAGPAWANFGSVELRFNGYHPNIDAEFGGRAHPFDDTFGDARGFMGQAQFARSLYHGVGSVEVGIMAGYWELYGHGLLPDGTRAPETTAFKVVPTALTLTYRFDYVAERYGIPFAPYARVAFDHYFWWINNGAGNTASFPGTGQSGSGGTNGYSLTGGIAFLLDFLDPSMARDMNRDSGVHHTYAFADFTKSYISDFHSRTSFDLSDNQVTVAFGILFVF